jgi:chemotaxis protein MotB
MAEEFNKKDRGGDVQAAGWEQIFCSLVLILVAFFAMLVSYSTIEGEKMTNFIRGFATESERSILAGMSSSTVLRKNMVSGGGTDPSGGGQEAAMGGNEPGSHGYLMKGSTDEPIYDGGMFLGAIKSIKSVIATGGDDANVDIVRTAHGFKATFGSKVLFSSGKAAVNHNAYPYLDEMIEIATKAPFSIRVEGHTDTEPIDTEEFPSNWELSTSRAINVLRYFLASGKITPEKIAAVGFGEYHPVASNDTPGGREKNRRVEFYYDINSTQRTKRERGDK